MLRPPSLAAAALLLTCLACSSAGPTGSGDGGSFGANDFFVNAASGSDNNPGTRAAPFASVRHAVDQLSDSGTIRVAGGTYMGDVALKSHLRIVGGYDPATWSRNPAAFPTRLRAEGFPVYGKGLSDIVLDGLDIATTHGSNSAVVTLDGATNISIIGSTITAAPGVDGAPGPEFTGTAQKGADGKAGAAAANCPPSRGGGSGGSGAGAGANGGAGGTGGAGDGFDGSKGSGANGGSAGAHGVFATNHANGGNGGRGGPSTGPGYAAQGESGNGGDSLGSLLPDEYVTSNGGTDGGKGADGSGGGGGGGGAGFIVFACGGGGGGGGQGGRGGNGGVGGEGGGSSIAILLVNTSITLSDTHVEAGEGGRGGAGGGGQPGGPGGTGGAGGAATGAGAAGGAGGDGEQGGYGGDAGSGGGGPSIAVLLSGSSTIELHNSTLSHGAAGAGGVRTGVGEAGKPGVAADSIRIPSRIP